MKKRFIAIMAVSLILFLTAVPCFAAGEGITTPIQLFDYPWNAASGFVSVDINVDPGSVRIDHGFRISFGDPSSGTVPFLDVLSISSGSIYFRSRQPGGGYSWVNEIYPKYGGRLFFGNHVMLYFDKCGNGVGGGDNAVYLHVTIPVCELVGSNRYDYFSTKTIRLNDISVMPTQLYLSTYGDGVVGGVSPHIPSYIAVYYEQYLGEALVELASMEQRAISAEERAEVAEQNYRDLAGLTENGDKSIVAGTVDAVGRTVIDVMGSFLDGISLFGISLRTIVTTVLVLIVCGAALILILKVVK